MSSLINMVSQRTHAKTISLLIQNSHNALTNKSAKNALGHQELESAGVYMTTETGKSTIMEMLLESIR
jgi:hypothetical protein